MPRRWTNAAAWSGGGQRNLPLENRLHQEWAARKAENRAYAEAVRENRRREAMRAPREIDSREKHLDKNTLGELLARLGIERI